MSAHPMLTSDPASSLNQIFGRAGIPKRFRSGEKHLVRIDDVKQPSARQNNESFEQSGGLETIPNQKTRV
jgi:hypothetical protein